MIDAARRPTAPARMIGRYALFDEVGHGGTATVHIGRLIGPAGFSKTVAIKKMHETVARDPEVAAMFLDEARLAGRIRHPNVVATIDVLALDGEAFLIMEYVHGESLASLLRTLRERHEPVPVHVAVQIVRDVLYGLHEAHEAKDEQGIPLGLVHRDVSPQNVLVGVDGVARVLDFGIAKALGRIQDTHTGQVKGKVSYMAPEQLLGQPIDRRVDVFTAGIVLWETLAGRKLFEGENSANVMYRVLSEKVPPLNSLVPAVPEAVAQAVARAVAKDPAHRFGSALEFAEELERAVPAISPRAMGEWVREVGGTKLAQRFDRLQAIEATPSGESFARFEAPREDAARARSAVPAAPDETTRSERWESSASDPARLVAPRSQRPRVAFAIGIVAMLVTMAVLFRAGARRRDGNPAAAALSAASAAPMPVDSTLAASSSIASASTTTTVGEASEASASSVDTSDARIDRNIRRTKKIPPAPAPRPRTRRPEDLFTRE